MTVIKRHAPKRAGEQLDAGPECCTPCFDPTKCRCNLSDAAIRSGEKAELDIGTTNIRHVASQRWKRWLGPANQCVVPLTSFLEYETTEDGKKVPVCFALDESWPLAVFAAIRANWTSVRKAREGEANADLNGFLTTEPNAIVAPVHPKAMPVILTTSEETDVWLRAGWEEREDAAAAAAGRQADDRGARGAAGSLYGRIALPQIARVTVG